MSHDPNNTKWSKSTENYGHKILSSQGWKPGDYLGAENAGHSDHYTAANASHIRLLLREDNLGLGAKVGRGNAETFGLSLFSGVLGRLNGKSDADVEKQQAAFRDAELRTYQTQKYGLMNFISGGLLVGDQIQPVREVNTAASKTTKKRQTEEMSGVKESERERHSKKTKVGIGSDASAHDVAESKTKGKKSKSKSGVEITTPDSSVKVDVDDVAIAGKKTKTKSRKKSRSNSDDADVTGERTTKAESSREKQERRARKEERRKRKEQKRIARSRQPSAEVSASQSDDAVHHPKVLSQTQTAPAFGGNRHAVRQRYIQQKRMAALNPQAMKEIFMLKAAS